MKAARALLVAGLLATVAACGTAGSGNLMTEQRDVGDFDSVRVGGGINLVLEVVPGGSQEVTVTYDDNLLDRVVTEVRGDTLVIENEGSFNIFGGGRFVTVVTPSLELLTASGGADVEGSGSTDGYALEVSGGADVDLRSLQAESVELEASGGADVSVTATESITGSASGGADVTVHGDPANARVETSGGADVDFR